jgi:predicted unusual protein kinase regulating ubiquinone biosynthesis (AarF/ABC1/UbiB family)
LPERFLLIKPDLALMRDSDSPDLNQPPEPEKNGKAFLSLRTSNSKAGLSAGKSKPAFSVNHGYDPKLAESAVNPFLLLVDPRFWRIAQVLFAVTMSNWAEEASESGDEGPSSSQLLRAKARWLTSNLVELGATFIKLGQFLSVRRDLLPTELAEELALLQDRVPPFPLNLVRETVRYELGDFPEKVFSRFEPEPLASASIGQVHQATLPDGTLVAVKVQRPNLSSLLYQDLGYMRWFAKFALALKLKGDWRGWLELSDEFGRTLFTEIDYIKEGRNADRLRHALRDRKNILIPRVLWKFTGRKVLTLEFIAGTKIDNIAELKTMNLDLNEVGKELIDCYMEQVMTNGFFHADPHAGNLAIQPKGKIVIYDFGMMGEITQEQRDTIWGAIGAVVNKDVNELVRYLVRLGVVRKSADTAPIARTLQPFIDYYSGRSILDLDFSLLEKDIDHIAMSGAIRLPPTLAYLIRTGVTLEGIARTLKPDFSFVDAAKPSLKRWLASQPSQAAGLLSLLYRKKVTLGEGRDLPLTSVKTLERSASSLSDSKSVALNGAQKLEQSLLVGNNMGRNEKPSPIGQSPVGWESLLKSQLPRAIGIGVVVIQFLFNLCYWQANLTTKIHSDSNLFLIGNGLMGAIILWLLAKPGSLMTRSKNRPDDRNK